MVVTDEQILWQAVLVRIIRDLGSVSLSDTEARRDAERWVGHFPSKEFREVCELAGFHADTVHRALRALCDAPLGERRRLVERVVGRDVKLDDGQGRAVIPRALPLGRLVAA